MDVAAVAELNGQLGYPAGEAAVQRRFEEIQRYDAGQVFVADDGERPIGWVHVYDTHLLEQDATAEIGGLVVADGRRGGGVGRALMAAAEHWAAQHGCQAVRVRSQTMREAAHAFYEHLGYAYLKTQKNFHKPLSS
jgi:GNAT superfamily N-acetyltransferase